MSLNLLLLVVFVKYEERLVHENNIRKKNEETNIVLAFNALDIQSENWLSSRHIDALLIELYDNYEDFRKFGGMCVDMNLI